MKLNCYRVTVECTNCSNDTFSTGNDEDTPKVEYYDCEDGVCYVIAKTMGDVERYFQNSPNITKIERVGIGYPQVLAQTPKG